MTSAHVWVRPADEQHRVHDAGDDADATTTIAAIVGNTAHMEVDDYEASVAAFYRDARHLTLHRPYSDEV